MLHALAARAMHGARSSRPCHRPHSRPGYTPDTRTARPALSRCAAQDAVMVIKTLPPATARPTPKAAQQLDIPHRALRSSPTTSMRRYPLPTQESRGSANGVRAPAPLTEGPTSDGDTHHLAQWQVPLALDRCASYGGIILPQLESLFLPASGRQQPSCGPESPAQVEQTVARLLALVNVQPGSQDGSDGHLK